jgi:hypothetical protein
MSRSFRTFRNRICAIGALAFFCCVSTARAGSLTTYPDFASWSAAVSGVTSVTIPDPAPDAFVFFGSGSESVIYDNVTFSTNSAISNGNFFNVGVLFSGDPAVLSSQEQSVGLANILISFPVPVLGFALNYGTFGGSAVTFALSNGDSATQGSTGSGYSVSDFIGATDSTAFSSVLVTSPDGVLNLNNVSFAVSASAVPEPSSAALLGMSFAGVVAFGWKRWRQARV